MQVPRRSALYCVHVLGAHTHRVDVGPSSVDIHVASLERGGGLSTPHSCMVQLAGQLLLVHGSSFVSVSACSAFETLLNFGGPLASGSIYGWVAKGVQCDHDRVGHQVRAFWQRYYGRVGVCPWSTAESLNHSM